MTYETPPRGNHSCYGNIAFSGRNGSRQNPPDQRSQCPDLQSEWARVVEKQKTEKIRSGASLGGVARGMTVFVY